MKAPVAPSGDMTFQEYAKQVLEARQRSAQAKADAQAVNKAEQEKLKRLADEIMALDERLDPEDLSAIQLLHAKRDQLARLQKQYEINAPKRIADAGKEFVVGAGRFMEFVNLELDAITDCLMPYCGDRAAARRVAVTTSSGAVLDRFITLERSFGGPSPADVDRALRCIASGWPIHVW